MAKFRNDKDAREWADCWVEAHAPSDSVLSALTGERGHAALFARDYGRFVAQFEVQYCSLVGLIDQLNFADKSRWPAHRAVQYALIAYNAKTFYSALDRLVKGYYEDSLTLTRGLYETFVRALFVSCHPDDAYSSLAFGPPKGVRRFNLTNFLRDELQLSWETSYSVMSTFAHSNSFRVLDALKRAAERVGEPERFGVSYQYDTKLAET